MHLKEIFNNFQSNLHVFLYQVLVELDKVLSWLLNIVYSNQSLKDSLILAFKKQAILSSHLCQTFLTLPRTQKNCKLMGEFKHEQPVFVH